MKQMVGKWKCFNPLTLEERLKLQQGLKQGLSYGKLALYVGRHKSVVLRESKRLGSHLLYNAEEAQKDFEYKQTPEGRKCRLSKTS